VQLFNTQAASKAVVGSTLVVTATGGMKEAMVVSHTQMGGTTGEEKVVATALQAGT
jgi:hypothetical protein